MQVPEVSIIIPVFNASKFIDQTLQSVFTQTFRDYEILAIDDGSTDDSLKKLKSYEPLIKVFSIPNSGPAAARNVGLKYACGKYIAFLDSDDLWLENKLEEQVNYLDKHDDVGLLFSEALMFMDKNGQHSILTQFGYTVEPTFAKLVYGNFIPTLTVMIRRECVNNVGFFNASLKGTEDHEYWLRIVSRYKMAGISRPLALYRIHNNNLIGNAKDINRCMTLALDALIEAEKSLPDMWHHHNIDKNMMLARIHIKTASLWKQKGNIVECAKKFREALSYCHDPIVFRWIIAAIVLKKWS